MGSSPTPSAINYGEKYIQNMDDKKIEKPLFQEGDWVKYNGEIYKIRGVGFNPSSNQIAYVLEKHNSDCLVSVLQSEAEKSVIAA